jgi:hypothetical protein
MILEYTENPLLTKITLNEYEKRLLFWRWNHQYIDDFLYFTINDCDLSNKQKLERLSKLQEKIEQKDYDEGEIRAFLGELDKSHGGDCVKVCSACVKCYIENIFEIDTLDKVLRGSLGHHVMLAFLENRNIDQAIEFLETNQYKNRSPEIKEMFIAMDRRAADYLKEYKKSGKIGRIETI